MSILNPCKNWLSKNNAIKNMKKEKARFIKYLNLPATVLNSVYVLSQESTVASVK